MATPTGWRRDGNLPAELTSFVGRTRLLANLKRHLGESRLVTVTGIGGVGKSRTVLRLAHQVRGLYPDGVWFADLARLQDAGMVRHTIASALGIADQSSRAESETLSEWVGDRDMLLIIDTCEHLVEGCAELVHELLEAAPNLKVLATSRQSLHLPYEQVVPVPPLQVPDDDPMENLFTNESVQLFTARAVAVQPDFMLDEDNINAVAELCRRSTASRSRSSWPRCGCARCRWSRSWACWPTGSACWPGPAARPCRVTRRCGRPSGGATSCASPPSGCCGRGCRCSLATSSSTRPGSCAPTSGCRRRTSPTW
ncbi:ATP-binding protein [Nonomuraea ferruginea]